MNFPEVKHNNLDSAYLDILDDLSNRGHLVESVQDRMSVGSNFGETSRSTIETIAYKFTLSNPRARLLYNEARHFDLPFAFAQFIWNISGSDQLNAISFYNGKGIDFSDDGYTIRGSSYGKRLFKMPGDKSQIESIVNRLKKDPASRRTFAAIFQPMDNVITTRDVPCPIGIQYLIRDNKLHAITFMRSNSAAIVLPYNVFFFTMLQEFIALEVGVEVGEYIHVCSSLHYYLDETPLVKRILASNIPTREPMQAMPKCSNMEYLHNLISFDSQLRRAVESPTFTAEHWIAMAKKFDPYWTQVALLLVYHSLKKTGQIEDIPLLTRELSPEYRFFVEESKITH